MSSSSRWSSRSEDSAPPAGAAGAAGARGARGDAGPEAPAPDIIDLDAYVVRRGKPRCALPLTRSSTSSGWSRQESRDSGLDVSSRPHRAPPAAPRSPRPAPRPAPPPPPHRQMQMQKVSALGELSSSSRSSALQLCPGPRDRRRREECRAFNLIKLKLEEIDRRLPAAAAPRAPRAPRSEPSSVTVSDKLVATDPVPPRPPRPPMVDRATAAARPALGDRRYSSAACSLRTASDGGAGAERHSAETAARRARARSSSCPAAALCVACRRYWRCVTARLCGDLD